MPLTIKLDALTIKKKQKKWNQQSTIATRLTNISHRCQNIHSIHVNAAVAYKKSERKTTTLFSMLF